MCIWRRMEKISWLDKVTNEEVLGEVNEDRQILNSLWQRKHRWIGLDMFWDTMDFCTKLLKAECKVTNKMEMKNSNATRFGKWWWLCCTQTGSWGQRYEDTQKVSMSKTVVQQISDDDEGRQRSLTMCLSVWIQYNTRPWRTDDRQTDTDTGRQQRPRLRIASCGKNCVQTDKKRLISLWVWGKGTRDKKPEIHSWGVSK